PSPGDWDGIAFGDENIDPTTKLNNCVIEYGGEYYGNIYCYNASPTITNCTIRHSSSYGVYSHEDGFTEFSGNTITSNAEYPLRIHGEYVRTLGSNNTLTGNTNDGIEVAGDYITTTGTWLSQGVPYIIAGDLSIEGTANPTITIAPGSTLKFRPDAALKVGSGDAGALVADGSSGQITFTASKSPPSPGDWDGIAFGDENIDPMTKLNNCVIEYGGGYYGNIYCYNASPTITNCEIAYSSTWGIYLYYSELDPAELLANNTFHDNADGDVGP
ncbi:MAG: right-handed parallel beta-helix repeat-containing protein, partial [Candidatus Stahlbacteria bacterium]